VNMLTFEDSIARFLKMVNHLLCLLEVDECTKLDELRKFIVNLVDDGACVLVRAFYMKFVLSPDGKKLLDKYNVSDWIIKEGKDIAFIPDPFFKLPYVEPFIHQYSQVFSCILHVYTFNKARRHHKLPYLFREMSSLAEYAYNIDLNLAKSLKLQQDRTPYFLFWVLDRAIDFMIGYLKVGFELGLYGEHEYKSILWYMYYLAKQRKEQHHVLLRYDQIQPPEIQLALKKGPKGKGKANSNKIAGKGVVKQTPPTSIVSTPHHNAITFEYLVLRAHFYYLQALDNAKGSAELTSKFNFGTPQTRYEDRFSHFFTVMSPFPIHYLNYRNSIKTEFEILSVDDLLNAANVTLKEAKSYIEKTLPQIQKSQSSLSKYRAEELKSVFKNLVSNGVNIYMISAKKIYNTPSKKITYNFDNFGSLPIINLV